MSLRSHKFLLLLSLLMFSLIVVYLTHVTGEQKKKKKKGVPNPDGSSFLSITSVKNYVRPKKAMRPMSLETIVVDFNEYTECTKLSPDALQSYGIEVVKIGPHGTQDGELLVWVHDSPCESGPLLQTLPFVGPSFLFIFTSPVSDVSIEAGDFQDSDSDEITLTAYADEALTKVISTDKGFISQDAPAQCIRLSCSEICIKAIEITTESYYNSDPYFNSVYVDNLKFRLSDASLEITRPLQGSDFDLTENYTATSNITFEATLTPLTISAAVNWDLNLEYQTSGGKGSGQDQRKFITDSMAEHSEVYESMGGQLTINATSQINECEVQAEPVIITITGVQIPDNLITERLVHLYHGPTSRLMTGLAQVESSYKQFSTRTLYDRSDLWPQESYDGGSHIGLMQVVTTMDRAWDWLENTKFGVDHFNGKVHSARRNVNAIRKMIREQYRGHLRTLNRVELENMALVYYGPYGVIPDGMTREEWLLTRQYYTPQQQAGGTWDWVVNNQGNPGGVGYVQNVRNSMK